MSEERLAYDNYILTRELDRRGDPSRDPCERIGHELDQAQTRIAQLERREALLTAFVLADDAYMLKDAPPQFVPWWSAAISSDPLLRSCQEARQALTDAGFTPDGWTEDQS